MDFGRASNSNQSSPTPPRSAGLDLVNMTILNTPQPRATSTVQRKSTLDRKYSARDPQEDKFWDEDNTVQNTTESSLGILNDLSSLLYETTERDTKRLSSIIKMDMERELARKLLQKCSELKTSSTLSDTNKENNVNMQNTTANATPSTLMDSGQASYLGQAGDQENTLQTPVVFEPTEITARSSALSKCLEKSGLETSSKTTGGISFNSTTAELMAQFNNEEFHSASQMDNQLLADEASWQENYSYGIPVAASSEKEYLDLSCFSGIIGELDLSVESCAGRKVSVGEFFKRKCGNIGNLTDGDIERPSIGFSVNSPKKRDKLVPLVDSTIMTEASSVHQESNHHTLSNTMKDTEDPSIMSLSTIAQALQDIDNGTPRRLIDQLIMAKKKKKHLQISEAHVVGNTYTVLPMDRKSMPATPDSNIEKFREDGSSNFSTKLSLDSKILTEMSEAEQKLPRMLSYSSELNVKMDTASESVSQRQKFSTELKNKNRLSLNQQKPDLKSYSEKKRTSLQGYEAPPTHYKTEKSFSSQNSKNQLDYQNMVNENVGAIKEENISYKLKDSTIASEQSNSQMEPEANKDVIIGRNTEDFCCCIVGVPRETDIELLNNSDKWIVCTINIHQIQGDKQTIMLEVPKESILINPNSTQMVKVGVKVVQMSKPIIAVLNIRIADMVTRSFRVIKHIICFKPEELQVNVIGLSKKNDLDFQCIAENCAACLPITIENRNSVNLPVKLSIIHNGPKVFSIEDFPGKSAKRNEVPTILQHIILNAGQQFTTNIEFKGYPRSDGETLQRLFRLEAKLLVQIKNEESSDLNINEVPLIVRVGSSKIQIVDAEAPIVISKKQNKSLSVVNVGTVAVNVSASIVWDEDSINVTKDFTIDPKGLFLQCNEMGSFTISYAPLSSDSGERHVRIKLVAGNNVYYHQVIGESPSSNSAESINDSYARCETPQYLVPASSPGSPHSVTSNRSGTSGRNSPNSCVSGATVAGDKIPIKATHAALVWNSIKAGKFDTKEFTIRNTSNNKIKIQALISDNDKSFKFSRDRLPGTSSIILTLQRMESKTLSVIFNPHRVGASAGKIIFRHYESKRDSNEPRPSKAIFLYGYGGCGKVEISEAFKDTSGNMWLSLGSLHSGTCLSAKVKLQNTGDLCSYAKIKLTPKALYPEMVSSWHVNPTELLLNPKEVQWVMVEFRPRKEDLALLRKSDVSHVGTVTITHGDEPTRWRIRRLYNKTMKENGNLGGSDNEAFKNIVYPLCTSFPGEQLIPDLNMIRDSILNLGDLCHGVRQYEIKLTMEINADETLSVLHDNADDSQMFYSLCSDNSHVYEAYGESFYPSETMAYQEMFHEAHDDHFTVKPSMVNLMPPLKNEATVSIMSTCRVAQPFETAISNSDLISVVPSEGMIPTGKAFPLKIQCRRTIERNFDAILEIYTENNKQDVLIKVAVRRQ